MMNLPLYVKSPDYHWYPKQVWTTSKKQSSHPQFCQFSLFYRAWPSAGPRLLKSLQKGMADVFSPPSLHFFLLPSFLLLGFSRSRHFKLFGCGSRWAWWLSSACMQQTAVGLLQGTNCGQKANINGKWLIVKG